MNRCSECIHNKSMVGCHKFRDAIDNALWDDEDTRNYGTVYDDVEEYTAANCAEFTCEED